MERFALQMLIAAILLAGGLILGVIGGLLLASAVADLIDIMCHP